MFGSHRLTVDPKVLAGHEGLAHYLGKELVIGIRPEDIEDAALVDDVAPGTTLETEVSLMESLGSEIILHFPLDAGPFAIMDAEFEGEDAVAASADDQGRFTYVARINPRSATRLGETVTLAVDTARLHYFDPESGLAIGHL